MLTPRSLRLLAVALPFAAAFVLAQARVPHGQDAPPGPPLSPQEALKKMRVPEGFTVELVASEPDLVNPVAMTFDERGRIWVTESLEYPRREPGPGRDRVKVLEDTDGDGRVDKTTVFLDGLNIPSGIAVGHGGVWVVNSPDILYVQDTDGDGKADKQEVVVTGFGRTDTHELPNSLTWGPDGWLYGLNGVFNHSHVRYAKTNPNYKEDHPGWPLTCAMFRIHPRTREFQVFAEGTSNPWGIAINEDGQFFLSACVIDHLWHIVETGYYHRQGGPYPPFTWKIESIVEHKHQKAAYCGITWFDSDAYPEQYRGKLYMGNIHGGCINVDSLTKHGATYKGHPEPDFLTAHDAWFMPVAQKTGPDGCLYILDWYDQYHCYQDANRDPAGIERAKGRLYRVRYQETPRAKNIDLGKATDDELVAMLDHPNVWRRETAQRLLQERGGEALEKVLAVWQDKKKSVRHRMHALWAAGGMSHFKDQVQQVRLGKGYDDNVAALVWQLRLWADHAPGDPQLAQFLMSHAPFGEYRVDALDLQVATAIGKLDSSRPGGPALKVRLWQTLASRLHDPVVLRIIWQNMHPLLEDHPDALIVDNPKTSGMPNGPAKASVLAPRIVDRLLGRKQFDAAVTVKYLRSFRREASLTEQSLDMIRTRWQNGEFKDENATKLRSELLPYLHEIMRGETLKSSSRIKPRSSSGQVSKAFLKDAGQDQKTVEAPREKEPATPVMLSAALLATALGDAQGIKVAREIAESPTSDMKLRGSALEALIAARDDSILATARVLLEPKADNPVELRSRLLAALGRVEQPEVAGVVLAHYAKFEPELQPRAIELLTGRVAWSQALLAAIAAKQVPVNALNVNQVKKILATQDPELTQQVAAVWGTIREGRDPNREQVIAEMRTLIRRTPGDAHQGQRIFGKVCGQCHKIYGEGQEVGPDVTLNGRNSFEQLLSNVFDPSLVIGAAYQARTVVTTGGRVVTGLVVEESPQRIVLKVQGGKQEVIPAGEIDETKVSEVSLMPEQLEKQLKPQEMADLFAFLTLDKPPSDPTARQLAGVREVVKRDTTKPDEFNQLLAEVAPGFACQACGELGVGLLPDWRGRGPAVRTHPLDMRRGCALTRKVELPAGKKSRLVLAVSHDPRGDWELIVKVNGKPVLTQLVGKDTTTDGWLDLSVDLTPYAANPIELELVNHPNNWAWEFAYWGRAEVVSE